MKQPDENKLDKLFRDGVSGADKPVNFREEDWTAMEKMLDGDSEKRGILVNWRYYASGIAALLLLMLGIIMMIKTDSTENKNQKVTATNHQINKRHNALPQQPLKIADTALASVNRIKPVRAQSGLPEKHDHYSPVEPVVRYQPHLFVPGTAGQLNDLTVDRHTLSASSTFTIDSAANAQAVIPLHDTAAVTISAPEKQDTKSVKPLIKHWPAFALSILAAPDVNGVNSFNNGRVGTNLGLQLTIQVTDKLSISTGAAYAVKPYQAGAGQYNFTRIPANQPTQVTANCKVLDVPINVNYRFYNKGKNSFSVGSGLSSYFMLRENYRFDYDDNPYLKPYALTVTDQNQHLLGVLNFNATYQRKINSKFSAIVQPYVKLPLTGIGNGSVNLKSTGVALGFSWNINPFGKPK